MLRKYFDRLLLAGQRPLDWFAVNDLLKGRHPKRTFQNTSNALILCFLAYINELKYTNE